MELFKSLENRTKLFNDPFEHFEINEPLTESAIKEIKNTSIKIAVESVKKIISTSVDKSKLDNLFDKNLEETKAELKKINS